MALWYTLSDFLLEQIAAQEGEHVEGLVGAYVLTPLHDWSGQFKGLAPLYDEAKRLHEE